MEKTNFEVKITDFGFATQLEFENESLSTKCGTPLYMSPE